MSQYLLLITQSTKSAANKKKKYEMRAASARLAAIEASGPGNLSIAPFPVKQLTSAKPNKEASHS